MSVLLFAFKYGIVARFRLGILVKFSMRDTTNGFTVYGSGGLATTWGQGRGVEGFRV